MKVTVEFDSPDELHEFLDWRRAKTTAIKAATGKTPIDEAELDVRTSKCLRAENILFVEDALAMKDYELLMIPNFGRKSIAALRAWRPESPPSAAPPAALSEGTP